MDPIRSMVVEKVPGSTNLRIRLVTDAGETWEEVAGGTLDYFNRETDGAGMVRLDFEIVRGVTSFGKSTDPA